MNIRRFSGPTRSASASLLLAIAATAPLALATGLRSSPEEYLGEGGRRVAASPEFYWAQEVTRLAKDFQAPEKLVFPPPPDPAAATPADIEDTRGRQRTFTSEIDLRDFEAALKAGRIKPPNTAEATSQHEAARNAIDGISEKSTRELPAEFDSEFANYHRGAHAFARGKEHWDAARAAWEKLLARPKAERHDRTVWAVFMLGKLAMKRGEYDAAIARFRETRTLAKDGFADSLGMAADSYGWEGRCEWKAGRPERAAPLFLTQLALGDTSAVISLKALVPDREPVWGMLNYGPEEEEIEKWTEEQKQEHLQMTQQQLAAAARDPLLRRLVTLHVLATATFGHLYGYGANDWQSRSQRWLEMNSALKLKSLRDAEYLGWAAYNIGDYKGAERWLGLAENGDAPAAAWLRAKLQRRAGKPAEAAKSMQTAWRGIAEQKIVVDGVELEEASSEGFTFRAQAGGDMAALQLARADFLQAFHIFRQAKLDGDAAYIAERVLTLEELKKAVDELPPNEASADSGTDWRYLLGRRLVRADRYVDAAKYLPQDYRQVLAIYVQALKEGADEKLPAPTRARAWFRAAWIARFDGMELMGTHEAPDGFSSQGSFAPTDLPAERTRGKYEHISYESAEEKKDVLPVLPKPTPEELRRLAQNKPKPDVRFHYRVIAGALAMKAAKLLPDGSEELADVINTAGNWVKDRDEKAADRYYVELAKRSPRSAVGRAVLARKWFFDQPGPWSTREQQEYEAMHKAIGARTEER